MTEDTKPPQWILDRANTIARTSTTRTELIAAIIEAMQEAGREVAFYFAGQAQAADYEAGAQYQAGVMAGMRDAAAATKPKCDGNHGGPACADPDCWQNEPAMSTPTQPEDRGLVDCGECFNGCPAGRCRAAAERKALAAAPAAAVEKTPERYCNKCGYFGPDALHQRPNGSGECGYLSYPTRAAAEPSDDAMKARYRGYRGKPLDENATNEERAAWEEGQRAAAAEPSNDGRKPLTDEEIKEAWAWFGKSPMLHKAAHDLVRWAEKKHGIESQP